MAHGDKKWIQDFSGRWKKSGDRSKKDYYGGLRDWSAYDTYSRYGYTTGSKRSEHYCPQCRYYAKPLEEESRRVQAVNDEIRAAFQKQYPKYNDDVLTNEWREMKFWKDFFPSSWDEYRKRRWEQEKKKTRDFEEFKKHYPLKEEYPWSYDIRSYLCEKHRNWYEKERESWQFDKHGRCCGRTMARRAELRKYRSKVRNAMRKARYDEDGYDNLPHFKPGWLD